MQRLASQKSEYLDYTNSAKIQFLNKKDIGLRKQQSANKFNDLTISESCFIPKFFDSNPNKFVELPRILPNNIKLSRFNQDYTLDKSNLRIKGSANCRSKQYPQKKKKFSYTPKEVLLFGIGNKSTHLHKSPLISLNIAQNHDKLTSIDQSYEKNQSRQLQAPGGLTTIILFNHGIKQLNCQTNPYKNSSPYKYSKTLQKQVSSSSPKKRNVQIFSTSSSRIKFTAYVEQGNNSRLVKEILRRRNWIKIITDKQKKHEANILWTCFLDFNFYNTAQCVCKFSEVSVKIINQSQKDDDTDQLLDSQNNLVKWESSIIRNIKQKHLLKPMKTIFLSNQLEQSSVQLQEKPKKVNINILNYQTLQLPPKKQHNSQQLRNRTLKYQKIVKIDFQLIQIHNHFREHYQLTDKKNLFENIKIYCKKMKINESIIIPKTYHIKKFAQKESIIRQIKKKASIQGIIQDNYEQTMESEKCINDSSKIIVQDLPSQVGNDSKLWIVKPGQDSNRGNNIKIVNTRQMIQNAIFQLSNMGKSTIIQQYIEPLLYKNRKFDIRCYVLLVSVRGVLRAYWYKEGYLRTCCKEFTLDPSNLYCHLTNDAVQKNHKDYGKYQQANKLSFLDLSNFLKNKQNMPSFHNIVESMKNLAKHSIKSVQKKLKLQPKVVCFQILGYDFLIDKNGKVWLIEVNTNPCLEFSGSLVSRIVWNMLQNTFQIVLDIFNTNNIENTIQNKYQCIY